MAENNEVTFSERLKLISIKHQALIAFISLALTLTISVSTILSNIDKIFQIIIFSVLSIIYIIIVYSYINKSKNHRELNKIYSDTKNQLNGNIESLYKVFNFTHNTWHEYKRFSDELHLGIKIEEIPERIWVLITNFLSNLRKSLSIILKDDTIKYCTIGVKYKITKLKIEQLRADNYHDIPIILKLLNFTDPLCTPTERPFKDKFNLDSSKINIDNSLFGKSFISKGIEYSNSFDGNDNYCYNLYKSGIVAPIILHEIPFAFIFLGSKNENVFSKNENQIIATFTDCIAELFRLNAIFKAINRSNIIVIHNKADVDKLIEDLKNKISLPYDGEIDNGKK